MDNKNKFGTILASIIFLVWFLISFVAMVILARVENYPAMLMVFGQYFCGFGLAALCTAKNGRFVGICTLMIGLAVIVLTFLHNWGSIFGIELNTPYVAGVCFLVFYIFVSGYMVYNSISKIMGLKERCTNYIEAECVEVKVKLSRNKDGRRRKCYMPVFLFEYNGEKHLVQSNIYSGVTAIKKGDMCGLYFNSEKPAEFYNDEVLKSIRVFGIVGGIMLGMGIIILYALVTL